MEDFILFDQIKKLLRQDEVYENFIKCIQLFNEHYISADQLFNIAISFIGKSPILLSQFKHLLHRHFNIQSQLKGKKKLNYEIDFSSCRKMGASYRALPVSFEVEICSGRTELCNQVLNDIWVSFPSWSEDIPSNSCKISAYQEFVYRCEDERYELDIVIENVKSSIKIYEEISAKMNSMSQEELAKFELDDQLGGSSSVLQKKVIERIYGDRAIDIIQGIKHKPMVAIPIALRRLKSKLADFEKHQTNFNRIWREQAERQTQKAFAHDVNVARANDLKDTRSKYILNVAEVLQAESDELSLIYGKNNYMRGQGFEYNDLNCAIDASNMLKYDLKCLASLENDHSLISIADDMLHIFYRVISYSNGCEDINQQKINFLTLYLNGYWFVIFNLHNKLSRKLFEIKQELQKYFSDIIANSDPYFDILSTMNDFISGSIDLVSLENKLKTKFNLKITNNALACDKLLQNIVRQLQLVITDEASKKIITYFLEYQMDDNHSNQDPELFQETKYTTYTAKIVQLLGEEYCFKLYIEYGKKKILSQMVDTDKYLVENGGLCQQWEQYLDKYLHENEDYELIDDFYKSLGIKNKLFLKRNLNLRLDKSKFIVIENDEISFPKLSYKFSFSLKSNFFFYKWNRKKKKNYSFDMSSKNQKMWFSKLTEKNLDN